MYLHDLVNLFFFLGSSLVSFVRTLVWLTLNHDSLYKQTDLHPTNLSLLNELSSKSSWES